MPNGFTETKASISSISSWSTSSDGHRSAGCSYPVVQLVDMSNFFMKVQLIYNVPSISAILQSDLVIYIKQCVCVCVCIYSFFSYYFPSCSNPRDWIQFPVLYSSSSLLIHSKWKSLHLPTPTPRLSHSLPRLPLPQVCSLLDPANKAVPFVNWEWVRAAEGLERSLKL